MAFSDLVANPGRLRILMALATTESQEFVQLRTSTRLTDGNLSAHAKRLSNAGLIGIDKAFRDGKPLTRFHLTHSGRRALEEHAHAVLSAVGSIVAHPPSPARSMAQADESDWVD